MYDSVTPWIAARQVSLSITNSRSLLRLMSTESVMPSNHLILCHPLLLLPSIFPRIRVFSSESVLHIRCPKYWSFSFSISTSNEYSGLISFSWFTMQLIALLSAVITVKWFCYAHIYSFFIMVYHRILNIVSVLCSACVLKSLSRVWLFANPWTITRGSSWPRDWTCVSCIGRQTLHHWDTWEAPGCTVGSCSILFIIAWIC